MPSLRSLVKRVLYGAAAALACAMPAKAQEELADQGPVVSLTIIADPVKSNGQPWDGYPAVGGRVIVPDGSNAPDIAVCVVLASGPADCIWRTVGKRKISHCPDAEKCTIPGIRLSSLPAGLIFLDVDLVRHDLIDFVILTADKTAPADIGRVQKNLQAAMARLTPGETPGERERRRRKARVLPVDRCVGESARCDLSQSRFWLEKR